MPLNVSQSAVPHTGYETNSCADVTHSSLTSEAPPPPPHLPPTTPNTHTHRLQLQPDETLCIVRGFRFSLLKRCPRVAFTQ